MQKIKIDIPNMEGYPSVDEDEVNKYLSMSDEERQAEFYNMTTGDLNQKDGINCDICKNRGNIAIVENGYMKMKKCECMKKRELYSRLSNCGMSKEQLRNYRFETFKADTDWQKVLINKIKDYISTLKENKYWLFIGGTTGAGKTHLCTALFQKLIGTGLVGKYMIWNSEISRLIMCKKSFKEEMQDEYINRVAELISCDILYIDDFMQRDFKVEDSLNIAYEIINARYNNPNKITIISSELVRDDLQDVISSVFGRIYQRTDNGRFFVNIIGGDKNYRLKVDES